MATSPNQIVKLTGLSPRYIRYLRSGAENPGGETLEKLIAACRAPREGEEWQDDLLPRLLEIPTREISGLTGFSKQYVNYLKNGERKNPSAQVIEKLRVAIYEYEARNQR